MASNDQILAALATMSETIADLRIQVSAVPEISHRTDEMMRVIKGHNGTPGLTTKVALQESVLTHHLEDYCLLQKEMRTGFEEIKSVIKSQNNQMIESATKLAEEERTERRDERKDSRKFRYDIALLFAAFIVDIILRLTNVY